MLNVKKYMLTLRSTATEDTLKPATPVDELHERVHVGLAARAPHGAHVPQVNQRGRLLQTIEGRQWFI